MEDTINLLKQIDVFAGIDDENLEKIKGLCKKESYAVGDAIFKDKSEGNDLYVILSGRVKIQLESITPYYEIAITTLEPGSILGEFALIDNEPRSATATCIDDVEALVIPGSEIHKLCDNNPAIGYMIMRNLARIICDKIRKTNKRLLNVIRWRLL